MIDLVRLSIERPMVRAKIRGQVVELLPICAADERNIRQAFPPPARVVTGDGRGGMKPDQSDPRQQEAERWRTIQCMAAAVLVTYGTAKADDPASLITGVESLLKVLTPGEVSEVWDLMNEATSIDRAGAEKN